MLCFLLYVFAEAAVRPCPSLPTFNTREHAYNGGWYYQPSAKLWVSTLALDICMDTGVEVCGSSISQINLCTQFCFVNVKICST